MKNVIEPCCIQSQLPRLMEEAKQGVFFSNGDWGVEKLMSAVSYLVDECATVVLLMPSVDVFFCRTLVKWLSRNWMDCVILATKEDCGVLVSNELKGYETRVLYQCRKNLATEAFVRYNERKKLVVFGPMRVKGSGEFCQYSYVRGGSWEDFGAVVSPIVGLFARKKKEGKGKCYGVMNFLDRSFLHGETVKREDDGIMN